MKILYLVRHAKSSWDYPELSDFDRPLNPRGERDAPRMAQYLADKNVQVDLMLSSPAKRAFETARHIASGLFYPSEVATDKRIYHAGEDTLLRVLREQNDAIHSVMMFGHNPGFTDFANELANESIVNIPTAGVSQINFPVDKWSDISFGSGTLIFFQYPKGL